MTVRCPGGILRSREGPGPRRKRKKRKHDETTLELGETANPGLYSSGSGSKESTWAGWVAEENQGEE